MFLSFIFVILALIPYVYFFRKNVNFLETDLSKGNKLLWSIYQIEEEVFCGRIPSQPKNPDYKFYSTLLETFLIYAKQFGMPLFNFLKDFKIHLRMDIQNEKKVLKELKEGIIQFIFLAFVSLSFWRFSYYFLNLKISYSNNFKIAIFLQFFGFFLFVCFFLFFKRRFLGPFGPLFSSYYLFWGLSSVGLPVVEVLGRSKVMEKKASDPHLKVLEKRIEGLVTSWKEKGFPVKEGVEEVIWDLWDQFNLRFQAFRRNLKIVNFLIMALFYLVAFFILLLDFIGIFLIELKWGPV